MLLLTHCFHPCLGLLHLALKLKKRKREESVRERERDRQTDREREGVREREPSLTCCLVLAWMVGSAIALLSFSCALARCSTPCWYCFFVFWTCPSRVLKAINESLAFSISPLIYSMCVCVCVCVCVRSVSIFG